jgi:hypothetical protein
MLPYIIVAPTSQVCASFTLLLQAIKNYDILCWGAPQEQNIHSTFGENRSSGSKFNGDTHTQTKW